MNPSKFELEVASVLKEMGISFLHSKSPPWCNGYTYDFIFTHENQLYVLESDGPYHFDVSFVKNQTTLDNIQYKDRKKMRYALGRGVKFIRIDYHYYKHNDIRMHVEEALESGLDIYVSDPSMYQYLNNSSVIVKDVGNTGNSSLYTSNMGPTSKLS